MSARVLVLAVLFSGCVMPDDRVAGEFLFAGLSGSVQRTFEDGQFHGSICGVSLPPPYRVDAAARSIQVARERYAEDSWPERRETIELVLEGGLQDWTSCGSSGLAAYTHPADPIPLNLSRQQFRFEFDIVRLDNRTLRVWDEISLGPGESATKTLDDNLTCEGDCGTSTWVHYRANLTFVNHGLWPRENIRYVAYEDIHPGR